MRLRTVSGGRAVGRSEQHLQEIGARARGVAGVHLHGAAFDQRIGKGRIEREGRIDVGLVARLVALRLTGAGAQHIGRGMGPVIGQGRIEIGLRIRPILARGAGSRPVRPDLRIAAASISARRKRPLPRSAIRSPAARHCRTAPGAAPCLRRRRHPCGAPAHRAARPLRRARPGRSGPARCNARREPRRRDRARWTPSRRRRRRWHRRRRRRLDRGRRRRRDCRSPPEWASRREDEYRPPPQNKGSAIKTRLGLSMGLDERRSRAKARASLLFMRAGSACSAGRKSAMVTSS